MCYVSPFGGRWFLTVVGAIWRCGRLLRDYYGRLDTPRKALRSYGGNAARGVIAAVRRTDRYSDSDAVARIIHSVTICWNPQLFQPASCDKLADPVKRSR